MLVLDEDVDVLLLGLETYIEQLRAEMKDKKIAGRGAEICNEALERADRLILRLKEQRDSKKAQQTALEWNQSLRKGEP